MTSTLCRLVKQATIHIGRGHQQFSRPAFVTKSSLLLNNCQRFQNVNTKAQDNHLQGHEHKHDKLWAAERYLSIGLLGVLPAAALVESPFMDYAVALSLVVHVHWGIEAIVTDYVRPSIFGPTIPKISIALVYVMSSLALGGLFMFNYTDVGISNAVRMLAKI